jgi:hypothetical protein
MKPRIPLPQEIATGPFTIRQGLDAGLGRNRLRSPDLVAPFHGVRSPAASILDTRGLCLALQQKLPAYARFCGVTAAAVMGVPIPARYRRERIVHVSVPHPHRAPIGRGVRGHSVRGSALDMRIWDGVRISSPERLWCELSGSLDDIELIVAGDFLIHWRLPFTNSGALADAVARFSGRRGVRGLQVAHPLLNDRSESPKESQLRAIVVLGGIGGVVANLPITTSGGNRYRADLAIPERRMIIEYQSELHRTPEAFRADMTRVSRLEADDWYVMLVNSDDLDDPAELLQRIRRVLARRPFAP